MDNKLTTFKEILLLWRKYIIVFILVVLLVFLGTTALNKLIKIPEKYVATATIELNLKYNDYLDFDTSTKKAFSFSRIDHDFYNMLGNDIPKDISLAVKHITDTNLLNVVASGKDKDTAMEFANKLADAIISNYNSIVQDNANETQNFKIIAKAYDADLILNTKFPLKLRIILTLFALFVSLSLVIAIEIMRTKVVKIEEVQNAINSKLVFGIGNDNNIFLLPKTKHDYSNDIKLLKECLSNINSGIFPESLLLLPINNGDYNFNIAKLIAKEVYNNENIAKELSIASLNQKINDQSIVAISPSISENHEVLNLISNFSKCVFLIKSNNCEYGKLKYINDLCDSSGLEIDSAIIYYI